MAEFLIAYNITMNHEGGYSNDLDDYGKETYKGISRKYHPYWLGWYIIDDYKSKYPCSFESKLLNNKELNEKVSHFYKIKFWDSNLLDRFDSQMIANELFDTGINMGVKTATKFLQEALNILNKNNKLYDDIIEDGIMGNNTVGALNLYLKLKDDSYLYKVINILQGCHYIANMIKDPTQEKFAYGWLKRVDFLKK